MARPLLNKCFHKNLFRNGQSAVQSWKCNFELRFSGVLTMPQAVQPNGQLAASTTLMDATLSGLYFISRVGMKLCGRWKITKHKSCFEQTNLIPCITRSTCRAWWNHAAVYKRKRTIPSKQQFPLKPFNTFSSTKPLSPQHPTLSRTSTVYWPLICHSIFCILRHRYTRFLSFCAFYFNYLETSYSTLFSLSRHWRHQNVWTATNHYISFPPCFGSLSTALASAKFVTISHSPGLIICPSIISSLVSPQPRYISLT